VEPMIGPVDIITPMVDSDSTVAGQRFSDWLQWIVCGGESGPGARPFQFRWARDLRDQCRAAGVPFFMKQVGAKPVDQVERGLDVYHEKGPDMGMRQVVIDDRPIRLKDGHGGDPSEWPSDLRIRQYPEAPR
jgi:protein gp37